MLLFFVLKKTIALDILLLLIYNAITNEDYGGFLVIKNNIWLHRFFGRKEAERILKEGIENFAQNLVDNQPADAKLFLAGAAFDFGINNQGYTAKEIIEQAEKHFPDAGIKKVKDYVQKVFEGMKEADMKPIDTYSQLIYKEYNSK